MSDQFLTETEMARSFLSLAPVVVSATGTIAHFHGERTELVDSAGGNVGRTLPNSLACTPGSCIQICKTAAANTLTVTPASGQTINGSATPITLTNQYASITLWRAASGWYCLTPTTP